MNSALCLICFKPNKIWMDFLGTFEHYNIYIIIDDNSIKYESQHENIHFIQILNDECDKKSFINLTFETIKKKITGWEKALYYFSYINTKHDNGWFIEDDVFFYNEQTLINIDVDYINSDLLIKGCDVNLTGEKTGWCWKNLDIKFDPPHYCSLCCAARMSRELISKFRDYATEHHTLFFLEAMIPTLCKKYNLTYNTPKELYTIVYRANYTLSDINKDYLYHTVKNMNNHILFRESFSNPRI